LNLRREHGQDDCIDVLGDEFVHRGNRSLVVAGRIFEHHLERPIVEDLAHACVDLSDCKLRALAALLTEQCVRPGETRNDAEPNRFALSKDDVRKSERARRGSSGCRGAHKKILPALGHETSFRRDE